MTFSGYRRERLRLTIFTKDSALYFGLLFLNKYTKDPFWILTWAMDTRIRDEIFSPETMKFFLVPLSVFSAGI